MTKPLHTRPFNLEHARAGAPFCCTNGEEVEILKWDFRDDQNCHLLGLVKAPDRDVPTKWTGVGQMPQGYMHFESRCLIMTPLGMVDGRPVFVGDELVTPTGMKWQATPLYRAERSLADCRWPAPAPVYPETRMDASEFHAIYLAHQKPTYYAGFTAIANAALRHAIDAGQVVVPSEATAGLRPFNPYTGRPRDQRDIDSDPMGHLVSHKDEPMRAHVESVTKEAYDQCSSDLGKAEKLLEALGYRSAGNGEWSLEAPRHFYGEIDGFYVEGNECSIRFVQELSKRGAARDMAIAEAVRDACREKFTGFTRSTSIKAAYAYSLVSEVELSAIIAGVKS